MGRGWVAGEEGGADDSDTDQDDIDGDDQCDDQDAETESSVLCELTLYADDVFPDLLGQERVRHELYQVIDSVDGGVDRLEPLDLLPDGQAVGHVGQVGRVVGHPGAGLLQPPTQLISLAIASHSLGSSLPTSHHSSLRIQLIPAPSSSLYLSSAAGPRHN